MQKIVAMLLAVIMLYSCSLAMAEDNRIPSPTILPVPVIVTPTPAPVYHPAPVPSLEAWLDVTEASLTMEAAMAATEHPTDVYSDETVAEITKVIGDKEVASLKVAEINGLTLKNVNANEDVVLGFVFVTEFSKEQTVVAVVTVDNTDTVLLPAVEDDGSLTITFPAKLAEAIEASKNTVLVILIG